MQMGEVMESKPQFGVRLDYSLQPQSLHDGGLALDPTLARSFAIPQPLPLVPRSGQGCVLRARLRAPYM